MNALYEYKKIENESNKEISKDMLTFYGIGLSSLIFSFICYKSVFFTIPILTGIGFSGLKRGFSTVRDFQSEIYEKVSELLKDTEAYIELIEEYNILLCSVCNYLKSKRFKSFKEMAMYLNLMIKKGYLSVDHEYNYRKLKYEYDKVVQVLGSRVMTGVGACRNTASLVTDVMNKCGYDSYSIAVSVKKQSSTSIFFDKLIGNPNHLVTAIIDEKEKYCYDPTNETFLLKSEKYSQLLTPLDYDLYYITQEQSQDIFNKHRKDIYERAMNLSFSTIDYNELQALRNDIQMFFKQEEKINEEFYHDEIKRITRVAELSQTLMPCSDDKIKSWVIK